MICGQHSLEEDLRLKLNKGSKFGLGNVDFGLSVGKVDVDAARDLLAVRSGVEDVADSLTLIEWMVSDLALLTTRVGEGNEELATRVGVEGVVGVALDLLLVPDLRGLALGIDLGDDLIEVRGGVHVLPERLTVVGVVATSIVLLSTVVGE